MRRDWGPPAERPAGVVRAHGIVFIVIIIVVVWLAAAGVGLIAACFGFVLAVSAEDLRGLRDGCVGFAAEVG